MSNSFQFKQFSINQDKTAMKVGTDGVLLAAWTSLKNHPQTILDIGAGTGLIALMLAQRSDAEQIDAIEIDEDAHEQCVDNFENSPWADRLFCFHASLDEFAEEMHEEKYDLIVCNPPFFVPNKAEHIPENRKKARFYDSLPFEDLINHASQLLSEEGEIAIIIPFNEEKKLIAYAETKALYPGTITRVRGHVNSPVKRSLLQFSLLKTPVIENELAIEISRHNYTEEYKELVKDFYLKL